MYPRRFLRPFSCRLLSIASIFARAPCTLISMNLRLVISYIHVTLLKTGTNFLANFSDFVFIAKFCPR